MAQFRYTAKGMDGKVIRGKAEAASESGLQQLLKEQGLYLIEAKDIQAARGGVKLSPRLLSSFCKELSALLSAGISIVRALEIVAGEEGLTAGFERVLRALVSDLKKGVGLSDAMEAQNCFPELMLGMVRSGEGNGNIDEVMERLALHYEREDRLHRQVQSAMVYPMVLLVMSVAVVILIVTFILPQFEELFAGMESLPGVTVFLMAASDFLVEQWYVLLLLLCIAGIMIRGTADDRLYQGTYAGGRPAEQGDLYGALCQDVKQSVFRRYAHCAGAADGRSYRGQSLCVRAV